MRQEHDEPKVVDAAPSGEWLIAGGVSGELLRSTDWSHSPLGPIDQWPQSLRTTVSLLLASNFPINVVWGPGHAQIYNDGYLPICGDKHPHSLGQNFRECWASAWPAVGDAFERAFRGETSFLENQRMFIDRNGYLEETFFTFSFSPIRDESGGVGGLFHPVNEVTANLLTERRTRTMRELTSRIAGGQTTGHVFDMACRALEDANLDVPFVAFLELEPNLTAARLVSHAGLLPEAAERLNCVELDMTTEIARAFARAAGTNSAHVSHLDPSAPYSEGPYPELPNMGVFVPITSPGAERPCCLMFAGVSARLPLTETYLAFLEGIASTVSWAIANARAEEEKNLRAQRLAELDHAKTTFFSNVSHELRSPLTLLLGPIQDGLADTDVPLPPAHRERQELALRNALRLHKLVDTLLDFTRFEAGRAQARFVPTDLSVLTTDLTSSFRSLVETAGLELVVDCPALPRAVYVDPAMWEKVVSNLLLNAFKFTFTGKIRVALTWLDQTVELSVTDTGIGIPRKELPRIFERFHRVEGARGRSHEGTGIGLALTEEIVKLHGGSARVDSVLGTGTTFTVSLPTASAHPPAEHAARTGPSTAADAFLAEASQWSDNDVARPVPASASSSRILVADDNADMRLYLTRLLSPHWTVVTARDGIEALAAAQAAPPDLIVADVMMPGMDGLSLVRALRLDVRTRLIPLLLLSARAGEKATVDGLKSGADDYLVKPFGANELLARIRAQLTVSQLRRDALLAAHAHSVEIARLLDEARRATRARERMLEIVTHDLRSPLSTVMIAAETLATIPATAGLLEKTHKQGAAILLSAERMHHLVCDLLDLTSIDAGGLAINVRPHSVADLLREVRDEFEQRAATKGLTLVVEVAPDVPALLSCDKPRIVQVLVNLLENALASTITGSLTIGAYRHKEGTLFSVSDTGCGMGAEALVEIFERSWQTSRWTRRGHGLGLAIAKGIVEAHGGELRAESEPGRGTMLSFTVSSTAGAAGVARLGGTSS